MSVRTLAGAPGWPSMTRRISWSIAALVAASLPACDGGAEGVACDPVTIVPGTWCITVTASDNTCARPIPPPYEAELMQAGNVVVATSSGTTYTGSLCGNTAVMTGDDPATPVSVTIIFASAAFATGASTWSGGGCSGTDAFTAIMGACP